MMSRLSATLTGAALAVALLASCSAPAAAPGGGGASTTSSSSATSAPASSSTRTPELAVSDSSLGSIVVDGQGMTIYMFDKDTQGAAKSVCTGDCATAWPAVTTESTTPTVDGVTGTVATITGADGTKQVTLDGWPLYYFAKDTKAGDVLGQGVGKVWWVLGPTGAKIGG